MIALFLFVSVDFYCVIRTEVSDMDTLLIEIWLVWQPTAPWRSIRFFFASSESSKQRCSADGTFRLCNWAGLLGGTRFFAASYSLEIQSEKFRAVVPVPLKYSRSVSNDLPGWFQRFDRRIQWHKKNGWSSVGLDSAVENGRGCIKRSIQWKSARTRSGAHSRSRISSRSEGPLAKFCFASPRFSSWCVKSWSNIEWKPTSYTPNAEILSPFTRLSKKNNDKKESSLPVNGRKTCIFFNQFPIT